MIKIGVHKVYPNRIKWLNEPTPYVQTLGKRTVLMNKWKLGELQKKYTQNLTCCIIIKSKSDVCLKSLFKVWLVIKNLFQNLTRRIFLHSNSCLSEKIFFFKIMLLKKIFFKIVLLNLHVKPKLCAVYGVKWIKTWFFVCKVFFKICFLIIIFPSESCFSKYFFFFIIVLSKINFFFKIMLFKRYFPSESDAS